MKKSFLLIIAFFLFFEKNTAQSNKTTDVYDIHFVVKGIYSGWSKFGYYYNENAYLLDSAKIDSITSQAHFKGEKILKGGMYFLAAPNSKPIDVVIDDDAVFDVFTTVQDQIDSLKIKGSKENETYSLYLKKLNRYTKAMEQIEFNRSLLQRATRDPEAFQSLRESMQQERKALEVYTDIFYKENPKLLCTKFLKSSSVPKIPDNIKPIQENKQANPLYYQYLRTHFWDEVDFKDERLMRSKIIATKLNTYLQNLTFQQEDSIKTAIDFVLQKANVNTKMKANILMLLASKFDNNYAPGADNVLIHLVDTYFPNDKDTTFTDLATLLRLRYKADINRPNRTGEVAKEMNLMQPDSTYLSMYSLKSDYTMLYFYSPLCSHCQEKLPIAYAAYQKYKNKGLLCYAVNTDQEVTYWKNYVREKNLDWYNVIDPNRAGTWDKDYTAYNLPVIYLLDKDKRILMKRIVPEQLENVLKLIFSK